MALDTCRSETVHTYKENQRVTLWTSSSSPSGRPPHSLRSISVITFYLCQSSYGNGRLTGVMAGVRCRSPCGREFRQTTQLISQMKSGRGEKGRPFSLSPAVKAALAQFCCLLAQWGHHHCDFCKGWINFQNSAHWLTLVFTGWLHEMTALSFVLDGRLLFIFFPKVFLQREKEKEVKKEREREGQSACCSH